MSASEPDHEQQVAAALLEARAEGTVNFIEVIYGSTGIDVLTQFPDINREAIDALCTPDTQLGIIEVVSYDPFEGHEIESDWVVGEVISASDTAMEEDTTLAVIGPGVVAIVECPILHEAVGCFVTLRLRGAASMEELVELAHALLREQLRGLNTPRFTSVTISRGPNDAEVTSEDTAETIEAKLTRGQG